MKILTFICAPILFIISLLYPKDRKIWLFGGWFGLRYADNSKDFFEYCIRSESDSSIKFIWVLKNKDLIAEVEASGGEWIYAYSWKGLRTQLKAKVFITCINSSDFIPFVITPRNYFVQLWHGSPIKYIGMDSRKTRLRRWLDSIRFRLIDGYDLMISPADCFDRIFKSAFGLQQNKIMRSGYPRNENLRLTEEKVMLIRNHFQCNPKTKLFVYLPTHRMEGKSQSPFVPLLEKFLEFGEEIDEKDLKVVVKPHFYEKDSLTHLKDNNGISIVYDLPFDLYELLGASDGLITDYSSVVFDYELLGRSMILFPFDYQEYSAADRPLYFAFEEIYRDLKNATKVVSIEELIEAMEQSVSVRKYLDQPTKYNIAFGAYSNKIYDRIAQDVLEQGLEQGK